jgi:large subunit ribosomal protein L11
LPCNEAKNDAILGQTFGQYGIKAIDFCKKFNEFTLSKNSTSGLLVKVIVTVYKDRSYDFYLKTPPQFFLFLKVYNDNYISVRDLYKILLIKRLDVFYLSLFTMYKNMLHTLIETYKYEIR